MPPLGFEDKVAFVWRVADKLRGNFRPHEYGSVMLPLLVLRRMDAVLADTKRDVLAKAATFDEIREAQSQMLKKVAGQRFYNTSRFTFTSLLNDPDVLAENLGDYIRHFSADATAVMEAYHLDDKIARMDKAGILYQVLADFADLDLRPAVVSNEAMGYIFEDLLRRFSEMSNETAGEHYTPREVIRLIVELLVNGQAHREIVESPAPVRRVYDPAAGTGGMLMTAMEHLKKLNPGTIVEVSGQELNPETWAIAQSDLMMQDIDPRHMRNGNSLTEDAFRGERYDFILANPPYGVDWKQYAAKIKDEHEKLKWSGRFGAGLPRVSDGSLLFLQHMLSKMKASGGRVGIVLSGSPLFSGPAGSGESEIRRWILEKDWLEGIVALPDQMFYNTGISTYIWILTNDKAPADQGRVKLIDARAMGTKMRKSLGDKRKELTDDGIANIGQLYGGAHDESADDARVKVLSRETFGFQRITVERPLRRRWEVGDQAMDLIHNGPMQFRDLVVLSGHSYSSQQELLADMAELPQLSLAAKRKFLAACAVIDPSAPVVMKKGQPEPDPELRDQENVPLPEGWLSLDDAARQEALVRTAEEHLTNEIRPYVPDAWIDHTKTKVGFEIPFTRQFYVYEPPRPVDEIAAEIRALEAQIQGWMKELGL